MSDATKLESRLAKSDSPVSKHIVGPQLSPSDGRLLVHNGERTSTSSMKYSLGCIGVGLGGLNTRLDIVSPMIYLSRASKSTLLLSPEDDGTTILAAAICLLQKWSC